MGRLLLLSNGHGEDLSGSLLARALARLGHTVEALPDGMKADLADLNAVHDLGDFRNNFATGPNANDKIVSAHGRFGSAVHPVVMHHPITGKPYLFVNEGFTQHIVGLTARNVLGKAFIHEQIGLAGDRE